MRGLIASVAACALALAACAAGAQVPDGWTPLVLPGRPAQGEAAPEHPSRAPGGPAAQPAPQAPARARDAAPPAAGGLGTVLPSFGSPPPDSEAGPRPADAPVRRRFRLRPPGADPGAPSPRPPVEQETLAPDPEPWVPLVPEAQAGEDRPWVPLVPEAAPAPGPRPPRKGARPGGEPEGQEKPWVPLVPSAPAPASGAAPPPGGGPDAPASAAPPASGGVPAEPRP